MSWKYARSKKAFEEPPPGLNGGGGELEILVMGARKETVIRITESTLHDSHTATWTPGPFAQS